jgi:hypothetical protein
MTYRIVEAVSQTLFSARKYLLNGKAAGSESEIEACVILAHAEMAIKLENLQN